MMAAGVEPVIAVDVEDYMEKRTPMDPKDGSSTKPAWAEEFSVHAAEDAYVQRRQFTKFLVLTSFGMVAGNGWIWLKALTAEERAEWPEAVVAQRVGDRGRHRAVLFLSRRRPIPASWSAAPTASSRPSARSARTCPAPSTTRRRSDRLECPCHEGYFSARTAACCRGRRRGRCRRCCLEQRGDDLVAIGMIDAGEGE